ncbi:MAG TPA: ABC transporter permease [Isosphaeraceae bacterium]|jgi:phospholipid/cholesterol/gamma-HCH transport system permease protein|nr:ABC transporter permease [Isosphaeraceae bacterium]
MATDLAPPTFVHGLVGGALLGFLGYLGGLVLLVGAAVRAVVRPAAGAPPLRTGLMAQWEWLFGAGLPLVALVHIGLGSFLAMQAYYGATFVEGAGPVVGVGLCRNVAPLMAGMTMAGLLAGRITWELTQRAHDQLDRERGWAPDRTVTVSLSQDAAPPSRPPIDPGRLTAVRVIAATVAGPILGIWGTVVGTTVGWLIALELLGVPTPIFFEKAFEMLWARDVVGVVTKGTTFGAVAALLACFEGLRTPADPQTLPNRAARAAYLSALVILLINGSWYLLMYMAGPAFGPTVLQPPVP